MEKIHGKPDSQESQVSGDIFWASFRGDLSDSNISVRCGLPSFQFLILQHVASSWISGIQKNPVRV